MPQRVVFSAELIDQLRDRVVAHNVMATRYGAEPAKLGPLKKLYKQCYQGPTPHETALAKVDQHLARMRGEPLLKAQQPRDPDGRFESTGGGQRALYQDVATRRDDRALRAENSGYDAAQTQVIPETRFSTFGPPIAGAAGLAYGAYSGASASLGGSRIERAFERGAGWIGAKAGQAAGYANPKHAAIGLQRGATGLINRTLHTTIPRPPPVSGAARGASSRAAEASGRFLASKAMRGINLAYSGPAAMARLGAERAGGGGLRGKILGTIAGAAAGAVFPGAVLYAPAAERYAAAVGPYLDAEFPRRVRKSVDDWLDAPEVLAKRAEILDSDLAKASPAELTSAALATGRRFLTRAGSLVRTIRTSADQGARVGGAVFDQPDVARQARSAFESRRAEFTVPPRRIGRAAVITGRAIGGAALGAGVGGVAGAATRYALNRFKPDEHPRDKEGKFARKGTGVVPGASIGAAIGIGAGLLEGLAAARRGHTALLDDAIQRLGAAVPAMRVQAEGAAREAHAQAFMDDNKRLVPQQAVGDRTPAYAHVRTYLIRNAQKAWNQTEGAAIRGGPRSWYKYQLDQAFDAEAAKTLRSVATRNNGKIAPLVDRAGAPIKGNLAEDLDPEALNPQQRKIFDDMTARRDKALADIDAVYEARRSVIKEVRDQIGELVEERKKLDRDLGYVEPRALELEEKDAPLSEIAAFARERLGHKIKARTKAEAFEELKKVIDEWKTKAEDRVDQIQAELDPKKGHLTDQLKQASAAVAQDMATAERMAIRNPFRSGKQAYLEPMPDPSAREAEFTRKAVQGFDKVSDAHADAAGAQLAGLMTAQQRALEAGKPATGMLGRAFAAAAPILAARLRQASEDYTAIAKANRAKLTGSQKAIYDWVNAQRDPKQAWQTARNVSGRAGRHAKVAGKFLLRNWKAAVTLGSLAGGIGAVDLNAPSGDRFRVNPKRWGNLKGIRIETMWPDPINRPNEALFGVSYKDRDGQQKFIQGIHIHSADGKHTTIPFGAEVDQVKSLIRNRNNQQNRGARAEPIEVKDEAAVKAAATALNQANAIRTVGPAEAPFRERSASMAGNASKDVSDGFYNKNVKYLEQYPGQSTNKPQRYWQSLESLFEEPKTDLLSRSERVGLLIGGGPHHYARGLFANAKGVFKQPDQADLAAVTNELVRQTAAFVPAEDGQYRDIKRALWIVGQHYKLNDLQMKRVNDALDQHYIRANSKDPPGPVQSPTPGAVAIIQAPTSRAGSPDRSRVLQEELLNAIPPEFRPDHFRADHEFRNAVHTFYTKYAEDERQQNPNAGEEEIHRRAVRRVSDVVGNAAMKLEPLGGGLRKSLMWRPPAANQNSPDLGTNGQASGPGMPKAPKMPGIGGAAARIPKTPPIQGAQQPGTPSIQGAASPGAASIGGASMPSTRPPRAPSLSTDLKNAARPTHALGNLGSYTGGELGYTLANAAASAIPGGGLVARGARFLTGALGGFAGSQAAGSAGRATGRALGDTKPQPQQSIGESIARAGAGWAGGAATRSAVQGIAGRAVASVAPKIAGAATQGLGERVGSWIGGALGEGLGGAAGTAAEPGGGTAVGGLAGQAIGAAIGGVGGYLADEGAGILYHHLSRYGDGIANFAAKTLGIGSGQPPKKPVQQQAA